jgi:hypothetical protein
MFSLHFNIISTNSSISNSLLSTKFFENRGRNMENEAGNSKLVFCVPDEGKQVRAQKILRRMAGM